LLTLTPRTAAWRHGRRPAIARRHFTAKLKYQTISRRTFDALAVENKDTVFRDDNLPSIGVIVSQSEHGNADGRPLWLTGFAPT